jgi:uncharacterized protein YndB with AHSA1/START domain
MTPPVGRTRDAGWEIGVSRTVPVPVEVVWDLLASEEGQAIWLGEGAALPHEKRAAYTTAEGTAGEVRSFRPLDRIRLTWRPEDWDHDTIVQVALSSRKPDRTVITLHQEHLADAGERERQRAHWTQVMDRLVAALG